jgi:hypothetical protein
MDHLTSKPFLGSSVLCGTETGERSRVVDPDPNPQGSSLIGVAGSEPGSRRAKMTHKNIKK